VHIGINRVFVKPTSNRQRNCTRPD